MFCLFHKYRILKTEQINIKKRENVIGYKFIYHIQCVKCGKVKVKTFDIGI